MNRGAEGGSNHQSKPEQNQALGQQSNLQNRSVEGLLRDLNSVPEQVRPTVRNNGGGHLNSPDVGAKSGDGCDA